MEDHSDKSKGSHLIQALYKEVKNQMKGVFRGSQDYEHIKGKFLEEFSDPQEVLCLHAEFGSISIRPGKSLYDFANSY